MKILKLDLECNFRQHCKFLIGDITFYLIYRSPNAPPGTMSDLERVIKNVEKNSVLIGDFNLPGIDWTTGTGPARLGSFVEGVDDAMLTQMVDFSTQVKGNCLDLVLTNILERVFEISEAGRLGRSDHEMILLTMTMESRGESSKREVPNCRQADWMSMRRELEGENWPQCLQAKTANEM